MKFINYLESISGIGIFPLLSLGIFFLFFVVLIIWTFRVSRKDILKMKNIPLDQSDSPKFNFYEKDN